MQFSCKERESALSFSLQSPPSREQGTNTSKATNQFIGDIILVYAEGKKAKGQTAQKVSLPYHHAVLFHAKKGEHRHRCTSHTSMKLLRIGQNTEILRRRGKCQAPSAGGVRSPFGSRSITRGNSVNHPTLQQGAFGNNALQPSFVPAAQCCKEFCGAGLAPAGHLWYCSLPQFIYFSNWEGHGMKHSKQKSQRPCSGV